MALPFREVPQNIQAEESVLGAILLDPVSVEIVAGILPPDAFSIQAHRTIYSTCLTLASTGKPTDLMTVTTYLHDRGKLNDVGGQAKLAQLVDRTVSSVNCDGYALLILEKFLKRKLIQAGEEITDLGYAPGDFAPIYDLAEQKLSAIGGNNSSEELVPISDTLIEAYRDLENRQAGLETPGYKCDFYDLDGMTGGFGKSDLIIVAGRPSMGKTAFAVQVAEAIAKGYEKSIAIFSIEMGRKQLVTRMLASRARVESNRLRVGQIYDKEWDALGLALGDLSELPIFINDSPVTTVSKIKSQCRKLIRQQKGELGLILVDYLQLMEGDEDNRVQQLSKMSRGLKLLARELDVPVMALSQLSRSVENRTDKRPMMSDLRDSGAIEQDADLILMLYRDEYYNPNTADRGIAEIILVKHRNGPTGTVKMLFDSQYTMFRNLARRD